LSAAAAVGRLAPAAGRARRGGSERGIIERRIAGAATDRGRQDAAGAIHGEAQHGDAAGSFGRNSSSLRHGQELGNDGIYVAVSGLNDDGRRVHSPSRLRPEQLQHELPDHEEHPDLRNRRKPAEHTIRDVRDVLACDCCADPAGAERDCDPQREPDSAVRCLCRASDFVLIRAVQHREYPSAPRPGTRHGPVERCKRAVRYSHPAGTVRGGLR
jgi:hypothetical protein